MKLCKKLLSLLLVLTVLAGFLVPAAADTADFNAGLTINRDTAGQITVTVIHSDVLVSEVPCSSGSRIRKCKSLCASILSQTSLCLSLRMAIGVSATT